MQSARPDPDELLARVVAEEKRERRGKLTVFFGAAPGVGKTYAMLETARLDREQKRDVVVGIVETHGRYDTAALLLGLDHLPKKKLEHRGVVIEELDLDAALARKPEILVLDELAHTNAQGSRHPKRWQDVEELLDAGIDVYTTMNVQHVESLNDVVARITGVSQRETVPDSVLERAHELKLIDLPPDDLLKRLREGKVYVPERARRAIENFFKKGNLIALRELALRHTAQRVDADMQAYRREHGIEHTWAATDRILVGVSPSPHSARLLRAGRRMAAALHAEWVALYVETPAASRLSPEDRAQLSHNLRLAEELGAETVTLAGESSSQEILRFARERNITKIVVGKPTLFRWRDWLKRSFVDQIVRGSGDVDVYVTAGDPERPDRTEAPRAPAQRRPLGYLAGAIATALATVCGALFFDRTERADVVMLYLLGIVLVSLRYGYGPSLLAAVLSVLSFDFFFVPPYYTLAVAELSHVLTFAVMFFVAVVISGLTQRVRLQADAARSAERRTAALYAMSRELAASQGFESILEIGTRHIQEGFACSVAIFAPKDDELGCVHESANLGPITEHESTVARWVFAHRREAGLGTTTLPESAALHLPLMASGAIVGVLSLFPAESTRFSDLEQRRLAGAFAAQLALAMERAALADETQKARLQVETEQLRNTLLSSVSHDLRTPLAVITGSASTLVADGESLAPEARRDLAENVVEEAERLNRLIRNLLDMTRLESGSVKLSQEWQPLEEVVGAALSRMDQRLGDREVRVRFAADLPLVFIDAALVEQLLINLLENAAKYAASGPVEVNASQDAQFVLLEVADRGPGIPPGEEERVFEKFHRAARKGSAGGVGLGLAICRAIAVAHGGRMWAENRDGGGASFKILLPARLEPGQESKASVRGEAPP